MAKYDKTFFHYKIYFFLKKVDFSHYCVVAWWFVEHVESCILNFGKVYSLQTLTVC